jgi:hypothetical protein
MRVPRLQIPLLQAAIFAAAALLCGWSPAHAATDWRYCLAASENGRALYVSSPFPTSATVVQLEKAYASWLDRHAAGHEAPSCPRFQSEQEALLAREDAIAFNRLRGLSPSPAAWRFDD